MSGNSYIENDDLNRAEEIAVEGDSAMHQYLGRCVSEIRRLRHELDDPNYQYVGRIHRQAILVRDARIDKLLKEIAELKAGTQPT